MAILRYVSTRWGKLLVPNGYGIGWVLKSKALQVFISDWSKKSLQEKNEEKKIKKYLWEHHILCAGDSSSFSFRIMTNENRHTFTTLLPRTHFKTNSSKVEVVLKNDRENHYNFNYCKLEKINRKMTNSKIFSFALTLFWWIA